MEIIYKDEAYAIQGACFEVYKTLGSGFLEAVYQEALAQEFRLQNIPFAEQCELKLQYKNIPLHQTYKPDFVVSEHLSCIHVAVHVLATYGTTEQVIVPCGVAPDRVYMARGVTPASVSSYLAFPSLP